MKLSTVLPEVFGSLANDVEKNERAWKEVQCSVSSDHLLYHKVTCFVCECEARAWERGCT